ncbi:MAG: hypothetical protein OEY34_08875 [Cyclobacteriaceae bacterium]|nr:hypothetical protein [Cyclobacteriaceae bacterium]
MSEESKCPNCNEINQFDTYCSNCGFPIRGTESEVESFNRRILLKINVLKDSKKKIKNVNILLSIIAGLHFILGLYYAMDEYTFLDGILNLIAGVMFIGCIIWVRSQPLIGVLAAFSLWIILQLSVVMVDPSLLFSGILLKVIFISIFIKGITSARDYQNYKAQLMEMGIKK